MTTSLMGIMGRRLVSDLSREVSIGFSTGKLLKDPARPAARRSAKLTSLLYDSGLNRAQTVPESCGFSLRRRDGQVRVLLLGWKFGRRDSKRRNSLPVPESLPIFLTFA